MKKLLKVVLIIVLIILMIGAGGFIYLTRGLDTVRSLEISSINPSLMENGIYSGSYTEGRWANEVLVTIKDGKISDIKITKNIPGPNETLPDKLFQQVIETQDIKVDIVSGATATSKAYLKSIENALSQ